MPPASDLPEATAGVEPQGGKIVLGDLQEDPFRAVCTCGLEGRLDKPATGASASRLRADAHGEDLGLPGDGSDEDHPGTVLDQGNGVQAGDLGGAPAGTKGGGVKVGEGGKLLCPGAADGHSGNLPPGRRASGGRM